MQSLSGLDASFLYLETPTTHMHVGGVSVFEGSLQFETFRQIIAERLHLIPRMRQRLVEVPLSIDYPYWVDDPDFNLDMHLQHIALPKPGGWRQLREMAARAFSQPLDRSRALWQIIFVEGLDTIPQVPPGSVALIAKIHHAAIDGASGTDMMGILFDVKPDPDPVESPTQPFNPPPVPNEAEMVVRSTMSFAKKPLKFPKIMANMATSTLKAGVLTRAQGVELPPIPFTAPTTRLNGVVTAQRDWNTALLELDRIKEIKNIMGVTVNDVMLAICAGALRNYLNEKGELPAKPLVAMVPISTRSKSQKATMGNRISMMFVQLATDLADPVARLKRIHESAKGGKTVQHALGARVLSDATEFVPFGLAGQATRLYSRMELSKRHNPPFNVVITNVPGPQFNLYMGGHKLLANLAMGPIFDGLGLIIPILSYNGVVSMSPTTSPSIMPDVDVFARLLRESANELEAEVLKLRVDPVGDSVDDSAETPTEPETTAFFELAKAHLKEHPELVQPEQGVFQFNITGAVERTWTIDVENAPGKVTKRKSKNADAEFTIRDDHLMRILRGELDMQIAFMQGKLKVKGDIGKALKLGPVLAKLPPLPAE